MYEESGNGGSAGRNALRSLRLAVWRLDDMGQEAEILARVRTVLALADIAYNHCQVYRIEDGRNGVSEPDAVRSDGAPRVIAHNLKADGLWRQLKEGGAGVRAAWQAANTCSRVPADAGEREHLIRQLYSEVGAILETSFDQGVLALYRADDVPFSATDAAWVEELGEVLSGLFYRLDDLQRLQEKEAQLRQVQKLQMVGQLTAEVAYEINNPLTVIIGESSLLLEDRLEPMVMDGVEAVHRAGLQARDISERLIECVRDQKTHKAWLNFNRLVQETAALVRRTLQTEQIEVAEDLEPNLPWIEAHAGQIQQVVLNLIQNSRDAIQQIRSSGRIVLRTSIRQGWIALEVDDDGPGIPDEIRDEIFEPFFTTKGQRQGMGLGLSICTGIAQDHDGRLLVEKSARGARIALELPIEQSAVMEAN